jgi:hypothetical protein
VAGRSIARSPRDRFARRVMDVEPVPTAGPLLIRLSLDTAAFDVNYDDIDFDLR